MPIRRVPGSDVEYFLISYDASGRERPEDDGSMLSRRLIDLVGKASSGITDVFMTSHGWKGDMTAAVEQYDSWIGAMAGLQSDRDYAAKRRPGFKPLIVGLHWPSLPFGDEHLADDQSATPMDREVNAYANRIADTATARDAIRSILETAKAGNHNDTIDSGMKSAYDTLFKESGLGTGDVGSAPDAEQEGWDPQRIVDEEKRDDAADGVDGQEQKSEGGFFASLKDHLLSPLRQASFWMMKRRARIFGETGAHELLGAMQQAAIDAKLETRFHLMGHSFGCIVVSATVAGAKSSKPVRKPIDSLFLVQGAFSIWAYAPDIPYATGTAGYFNPIVKNGLVSGPIVTTQSSFDRAVGRYYPRGAQVRKQLVLVDTPYPKYGGVGTFGIQGMPNTPETPKIRVATAPYGFKNGNIYNIDSSRIIKTGGWPSGAHSDIAHPEVAHIFWEASLTGL
jgi:hypothetical protein